MGKTLMAGVIITALYDKRAELVTAIQLSRNANVAIREFEEAVRDPKLRDSMFVRHLADYALVRLGTLDEETGLIETIHNVPVRSDVLIDGASLVLDTPEGDQ